MLGIELSVLADARNLQLSSLHLAILLLLAALQRISHRKFPALQHHTQLTGDPGSLRETASA